MTHLEIMHVSRFKASYYGIVLDINVSTEGSMETIDVLLQIFNTNPLGRLGLTGREAWGNLPESIQHFTSITYLKIQNFGMEELPEWLGNLSSLKVLKIYYCKKLRCLHALRGLTSLRYLEINGCPEISIEQQSDEVDSQWPNICHIRYIWIDGDILGEYEYIFIVLTFIDLLIKPFLH